MTDIVNVHLDFETYGEVDLPKVGPYVYAEDDRTEVMVVSWAVEDDPAKVWFPYLQSTPPSELFELMSNSNVRWWAHNIGFEYAVWNMALGRYTGAPIPVLPPEQTACTMALAYHMGLPGGLDDAARSLGLKFRKDVEGHKLMMKLCKPRYDRTTKKYERVVPTQEEIERLGEYCRQDVVVERELHRTCLKLSGFGRRLFVLDRIINDRGVYIDEGNVTKLIELTDSAKAEIASEIKEATGGYVPTANATQKIGEYIREQGVEMPDVTSPRVLEMLADDSRDLPDNVRRVLELRRDGSKTSTAKLNKMLMTRMKDGRARGMFQYHGAQRTGRFAGRLIQLQNLFRPVIGQEYIDALLDGKMTPQEVSKATGQPIMAVVASCLRGVLTAGPGMCLLSNDFSNIEGRVLAWLAGEKWKLQAFRDFDSGSGPDLYLVAAGGLYDCSLEAAKPHRQVGKVFELSMGFGGGYGAYANMCKAYGVDPMPEEQFQPFKWKWRDMNSRIKGYWQVLEEAAIHSVRNPGAVVEAGAVRFHTSGTLLRANLPSGRNLQYPFPEIRLVDSPFGARDALTYMGVVGYNSNADVIADVDANGSWQRMSTWGGKLAENMTQAVAGDVLFEAMLRLEEHGYPIVLHVHDEIVCEVPVSRRFRNLKGSLKEMARIMEVTPDWAEGLPVSAEGWEGKRYRK